MIPGRTVNTSRTAKGIPAPSFPHVDKTAFNSLYEGILVSGTCMGGQRNVPSMFPNVVVSIARGYMVYSDGSCFLITHTLLQGTCTTLWDTHWESHLPLAWTTQD
eukprot:2405495-Amphidinium_carterae.1